MKNTKTCFQRGKPNHPKKQKKNKKKQKKTKTKTKNKNSPSTTCRKTSPT